MIPHIFTGSVTIDGAPAPDGTVVAAWLEDFTEPLAEISVSNGRYGFNVPQYGSRPLAGRTITFKIGGLDAQETAVWQSGEGDVLDLTASN